MNEIHAITTCIICHSDLGLSYKFCEVCVDYYFCWDCYLNNAITGNHELHHPVLTTSLNFIDPLNLFEGYVDHVHDSDEEANLLDSDDEDLFDDVPEPPLIPIVNIEIVDGPAEPEDEEELEEPIDVNAPAWEYSSPEASSTSSFSSLSSISSMSSDEDSLVEQFMNNLLDDA